MPVSKKLLLGVAASVLLAGATGFWRDEARDENKPSKIIDYGQGPGRPPAWVQQQPAAIASGSSTAAVTGVFGAPVPWPILPIHMALLPDGRVMTFGSSTNGQQGASLSYDVWTPSLGTGANAHMVLPNPTATNVFCGAQALIAGTGELLMVGGTLLEQTAGKESYYGINNVTAFQPLTNKMVSAAPMLNERWYASMVPLPNGDVLVAGGRSAPPATYVTTPEIYDSVKGWQALTNAASNAAFGLFQNWWYPRIFPQPSGGLIELGYDGRLYTIDPTGNAPTTGINKGLQSGSPDRPDAMFAPGMILSLRSGAGAQIIDLNGPAPVVTTTANIDQSRAWSNMTVLADGTVVVTGGSATRDGLSSPDLRAEIWNPATGAWTPGARAAKARLYHSAAILLRDGTVLTGGGGDPGPVRNMNAEIFYPPYLFGRSGEPAARPIIMAAPSSSQIGTLLTIEVASSDTISQVTILRAGAATHSMNLEQRFFNLEFSQTGQTVTALLPSNEALFSPGLYVAFVFQNGVPSVGSLLSVTE